MRASSLIYEILKGCGVSDNAAQAMETVTKTVLGNNNHEVYVEINEAIDKDISNFQRDLNGNLCLKIEVKKDEIE